MLVRLFHCNTAMSIATFRLAREAEEQKLKEAEVIAAPSPAEEVCPVPEKPAAESSTTSATATMKSNTKTASKK